MEQKGQTKMEAYIYLRDRSCHSHIQLKKKKIIIRSNPPIDPLWNEMMNLKKQFNPNLL